jgi:hypothetical protein
VTRLDAPILSSPRGLPCGEKKKTNRANTRKPRLPALLQSPPPLLLMHQPRHQQTFLHHPQQRPQCLWLPMHKCQPMALILVARICLRCGAT